MDFDWSEYLLLAYELTGHTVAVPAGQEARLRASLSRAYYAVFCEARNYLERRENTSYRYGAAHQEIPEKLRNSPDPDQQEVSKILITLREARKRADYRDNIPRLNPNNVELSLGYAKEGLALLDQLRNT